MPRQPFLALITPLAGGDGGGGNPPGIWGGGGVGNYPDAGFPGPQPGRPVYPSHPIYYPGLGFWGGSGVGNYPDAGFPAPQPPGTPPLGIWGGGGVGNYPDAGFPGPQPGQPGRPTHPIYYPPEVSGGPINPYPDIGFPGPQPGGPVRPTHPIYYPPVIWDPSRPANPIVNPGDPNHPGEGQPGQDVPKIEWKTAWSPSTGWIVVGVPTGEHVTPSGSSENPSP